MRFGILLLMLNSIINLFLTKERSSVKNFNTYPHTTKYSPFETLLRGRFVFLVKLLCFGEKIDLALVFSLEKCYYNNV